MKREKHKLISIKEINEEYDLSLSTLNYYNDLDLLRVTARDGNKRLYDEQDVKARIEKIKELQQQGYPLRLIKKEIRTLFDDED